MSNVLIVTDLEGVTGVCDMQSVKNENSKEYQTACKQLMHETNLAITALIDAGASLVYVFDGHASGKNFIPNELDGRAVQVWGSDLSWVMEEISGFVMLGAHSMAGNKEGFFSHTLMWEEFKTYRHNGRCVSETDIIATYAGLYDVPCIAITGDNHACREAESVYHGIQTAVVKKAVSRDKAIPLPQDEADKLIYSAMVNGFENRQNVKPLKEEFPLVVEVEFSTEQDLKKWCKNRTDIEFDGKLNAKSIKNKQDVKFEYDLFL